MYDESEDKIQCSECGGWYKSLQTHVRLQHKMLANDYRDKHGIYRSAPLISVGMSARRREVALKRNIIENLKTPDVMKKAATHLRKNQKKIQQAAKKSRHSVMHNNLRGLCDAQIAARIIVARDTLGFRDVSEMTMSNLGQVDKNLATVLRDRYGSIKLATNALGLGHSKHGFSRRYSDSTIISKIRRFVLTKKHLPRQDHFRKAKQNDLPSIKVVTRQFGSIRRSLMMSGAEQLLEEIR